MPWYYHSGNVIRSVPVKPGVAQAVRPHSKVEILVMTPEAQALIRKGALRRTGRPKGVKVATAKAKAEVKDEPKMADVVERSALAKNIAEKGVTGSKGIPPKPVKGKVAEMTEGEKAGATKGGADLVDKLSNAAGAEDVDKKGKKSAGKKRR